MYHKILETDEAINDIHLISCEAYEYTRDKKSGYNFINLYDATVANIAIFSDGFSVTDMKYRNYIIHILPFGNYNIFFVVDNVNKVVTILRILYQKQDWGRILRIHNSYRIDGNIIT